MSRLIALSGFGPIAYVLLWAVLEPAPPGFYDQPIELDDATDVTGAGHPEPQPDPSPSWGLERQPGLPNSRRRGEPELGRSLARACT